MPKHGKKYLEAAAKIDRNKDYTPEEAIRLVKETSITKFDAPVEVHMRLGVDPRHADQMVRGVVLMPNGLGKTVRILVFAEGEDATIAQEAGADYVGGEELAQRIQGGWLDFDLVLATPPMMRFVGRLGRILGPRGLMPSPRTGTIAQGNELGRLIDEARMGRVEFRVDKTSNLHAIIGKVSFDPEQLMGNLTAFMVAVKRARPASAKGTYIRKVVLSSCMGPGIKVDAALARAMETA
ncbi:MAG: 50S ribosomal protein L1 [Anaerolineae bacterium]|nr:50S ribosomal protein L1 [Anaerolineae bacterium]